MPREALLGLLKVEMLQYLDKKGDHAMKFSDVVPATQAPKVAGVPTLDAFRAHMKRDPNAPKPFKIGFQNFYMRRELAAWKRKRDAARKAK
jgi:hypothetical protein